MVHMLDANLYGTPQACKVYITCAYEHLRKHGYQQCKSDPNVFKRTMTEGTVIMVLTIDDFLVAASSREVYNELISTLELKYKVSDLGKATRILNWTLTRPQPYCYHLSQPHMIEHFVDLMGMSRSNPVRSPQAPGHPLDGQWH